MTDDTTPADFASYTGYPPEGQPTTPDAYTLTLEGGDYPVSQFDRTGDRLLVTINVATAVEQGRRFEDIWRHRLVSIETPEEKAEARILWCQIEHGDALLALEPAGGADGG